MVKYLPVLLCLFFAVTVKAQVAREYQVKAAFLFNFGQFVEWPPSSFTATNTPFVIGILGSDPFGSFIDETVAGEKVSGHPIIVQRYTDVKEIRNCHVLFINQPYSSEIANFLNNRSILTVSDENDFAKNGGMIRFSTQKNKIRLQINPSAAKAAKLTISSKLLRLAEIVD